VARRVLRPMRANPSGDDRPRPVDPAFWTTARQFDMAGGPDVRVLTAAGREVAFAVGARVARGPDGDALRRLHALGGAAALETRRGARMSLTALGEEFPNLVWSRLAERGYVARTGDGVRLTPAGAAAVAEGRREEERLLERVRRAHPIAAPAEPWFPAVPVFEPARPRRTPQPSPPAPPSPANADPGLALRVGDRFEVTKGSTKIGVGIRNTGTVRRVERMPDDTRVIVGLSLVWPLIYPKRGNAVTLYAAHPNRLADREISLLNDRGDRILIRKVTR
jgi:hypothetical protein